MAPGVSRQKNNYFYRAGSVGLLSAYYRPPLVEVQSVLWLRPRTGGRVALLWEDKPNGAKAHSSGKLKFPSSQPMLIPHRRRKQRSFALPPQHSSSKLGSAFGSDVL